MPTEKIEIEVTEEGTLRTIYEDNTREMLEALGDISVKRASRVEWESSPDCRIGVAGWTVRAAHNADLAIRVRGEGLTGDDLVVSNDKMHLPIAVFPSREDALKCEREHFWELLPSPPKKPTCGCHCRGGCCDPYAPCAHPCPQHVPY